jgi:hypothetical protein
VLSQNEIETAAEAVGAAARSGDHDAAWDAAAPLRDTQRAQRSVAVALLGLVEERAFSVEHALEIVRQIFDAHGDANDDSDGTGDEGDALLGAMGSVLDAAHDVRFLNGPPPTDPIFERTARRLRDRVVARRGDDIEAVLQAGLATVGRLLGRAWDGDTERAYLRLVELKPDRWEEHYNLGLFYKNRGRFAEGVLANYRAASLGGEDDDSVRWNLGICATGARDATIALSVWEAIGQHVELGRFGLPEGGYDQVKVRLAQHPMAERSADQNGPGIEESIWVERLSPCHGIVRSALYRDLGVDYGDVVLFDGAPVTYHTVGDEKVPVFPHLATLERPGYRIFPFVGTQTKQGAIQALSGSLPDDTVLYSHTEKVAVLCAQCWESGKVDHALAHKEGPQHVVRGKLCAPPSVPVADLRRALDDAVAKSPGVRVYVPALSRLLGDEARAEEETRRMAMAPDP